MAGATGAALAVTALRPAQAAAATASLGSSTVTAAGIGGRTFTASQLGLELGGVSQGRLHSADGGDAFGEVVSEPLGGNQYHRKHLGRVGYDDFTIEADFASLGLDLSQWVVDTLGYQRPRRTGDILSADFSGHVGAKRHFTNALITQVTIPSCDATAKEPGFLSVAFAPEVATDAAPTGTLTAPLSKGRPWVRSNYRLEIDGLDCTRVSKIDAITIRQSTDSAVGDVRFPTDTGAVEFSDLIVTLGLSSVTSWKTWFDDFVIAGNCDNLHERSGKLTLLSSDLATELAVLQLHNIGIYRLDPDGEPGGALPRAHAALYVEQMNFTKLGSWSLS